MSANLTDGIVIEFDRLTVRYGRKTAVENLSIQIPQGSVYALLGSNGAGKSSAIRCLLGQQKASAGRVLLFGQDVWQKRAQIMDRIGVIPEEPDAPPDMTAKEIINFCGTLYRTWDSKSALQRLDRFKVPTNVAFGKLSKGQKAQVALALALASSPELLVLDDPTLGLDVVARKNFFEELIGELADRGMTVILTSHDLAGVERIADRVGILKDNQLAVNDEIDNIKANFRRIRYANTGRELAPVYNQQLDGLATIQVKVSTLAVEAVVSNFSDRSFAQIKQVGGLLDAEVSAMSLEEIFTAVVGENKGE